jgi:hypothetical protein
MVERRTGLHLRPEHKFFGNLDTRKGDHNRSWLKKKPSIPDHRRKPRRDLGHGFGDRLFAIDPREVAKDNLSVTLDNRLEQEKGVVDGIECCQPHGRPPNSGPSRGRDGPAKSMDHLDATCDDLIIAQW